MIDFDWMILTPFELMLGCLYIANNLIRAQSSQESIISILANHCVQLWGGQFDFE
jgi:hypothetical protein